jgi:hypothetical protein
MALICPINRGTVPLPRRSYITTGTFHTDIFKYTTALNSSYVTVGTLTTLDALGTGTATNCPANRVLRENGRALNPDANPISTLVKSSGSAAFTLQAVLVGVYDAISGLSGFIDPNSSKFQLYNGSRANFAIEGVNPVSGYKDALVRAATSLSLGPPTAGNTYTVSMDANLAQTFTLAPVAAQTNIVGIPAASATTPIPPVGSLTYLIITFPAGSGTSLVKFTTSGSGLVGIRESADINFTTASAGDIVVVTFISDGSKLVEVTRSGLDTIGAALATAAATQAIVQPATGGGNA